MRRKTWKSVLGLVLCVIIWAFFVCGLATARSAVEGSASGERIGWSLEIRFAAPGTSANQDAAQRADALVSKLNGKGLKAGKEIAGNGDHTVRVSGDDTVEGLRTFLYSVVKPDFYLPGGVTEMEIESPASEGENLTLVLESNRSTGYVWQVAAGSGMKLAAPHVYERHTPGYGFPERQTVRLSASGGAPIKLVYKRPWEDSAPTRKLKLRLERLPATLDLSDPGSPIGQAPALKGVINPEAFPKISADALPAHFDWREKGVVPSVRDQGNCGGCWAFGTVGIMESSLMLNGAASQDFSEQFLISCNISDWNCGGGWTAHAYHYNTLGKSQNTIGAVDESAKPYTATNGTCRTNYVKPYALTGWQFVTGSEYTMPTVDQLKSAIYTYGPITAGVCAGGGWDWYSGGVFTTDETSACCDPLTDPCTNHQIILVGWDDADQYWILRNSWGAGWGDGGYMYIRYGISRVGEGPSWVTSNPGLCSYRITSSSSVSFAAGGGSTTIKIGVTGTGCPQPQVAIGGGADWLGYSWLSYKNNAGSLKIRTAAATGSKERTAVMTIGGEAVLNVTQKGKPCSFGLLKPLNAFYDGDAHTGNTLTVTTRPSDCEWTASVVSPSDTWVHMTAGITGTGGSSITYDVDANQGKGRTGKIRVGMALKPETARSFNIFQGKKVK